MNKRKWTESEEKILQDCLKENSKKKEDAFEKASTMLDRSNTAIVQHYYYLQAKTASKSNKVKFSKPYTSKEKEDRIISFLENSTEKTYDSLSKELNLSRQYLANCAAELRKKYPEKNLRRLSSFVEERISTKELKTIMCEEISNSPDNLQEAFRRISEKTGISPRTIASYWYGKHRWDGHKELRRNNMPELFYRSGSSGTAKNEKNSNKLEVSKGNFVFNFITQLIKGKYKVKSKDKKK